MQEKASVPAIRFAGFTDAWERRKLGDIANLLTGYPFESKRFSTTGIKLVRGMNVKRGYLDFSEELCAHWETASGLERYLLEDGDILIQMDGALIGKSYAKIAEDQLPALLVQRVTRTRVFPSAADRGFIYQAIQKGFLPYIKGTKTETAVPHLSLDDIASFQISIPDVSEQKQIGCYLDYLDHLITLHQSKYSRLCNIKKSMLERMFPREGTAVPEIRFAGFTDAWKQRKVGELLIERDEQAPVSNEYPLMAFIANEGVAPKGDRYDRSALVSDVAGKLYKKTEMDDFIYSSNNLETGSIGLNKYGKASISPVYSIFYPTGIADANFLGRRLVRKDFINAMIKWRQGVIYGQWRIHESDFMKIEIPVPSVEEQRKIGEFLDNLDHLITLHQRELERLQNIKKSCLEKMFV